MNWAIIRDDSWLLPKWAAREVVSITDKTFTYLDREGQKKRRNIIGLRVKDLNQSYAERAVELLNSSRALCEEERKKAEHRHIDRVNALTKKAREGEKL